MRVRECRKRWLHRTLNFIWQPSMLLPLPDSISGLRDQQLCNQFGSRQAGSLSRISVILKPGGRLAVSDIALEPGLATRRRLRAWPPMLAVSLERSKSKTTERGWCAAGFEHVEIVDSGADLNAYAKIENRAGCCSPSMLIRPMG